MRISLKRIEKFLHRSNKQTQICDAQQKWRHTKLNDNYPFNRSLERIENYTGQSLIVITVPGESP